MNSTLNHFSKNYKFYCTGLFILMILVCIPRFNQINLWILKDIVGNKGHMGDFNIDTLNYLDMIAFFRGEIELENSIISQPYSYRIFPILIAAILPFEALTSLNIINLICNMMSLALILGIFKHLKVNKGIRILTTPLFIFSFPLFYFGTSGVVDPMLISILLIGFLFSLKNNFPVLILISVIGSLVKETSIIIIPVYFLLNMKQSKNFLKTFVLGTVFLLSTFLVAREVIPITGNHNFTPSWDFIKDNLTRTRAYASYFISYFYFVPLLFIYLKYLPKDNIRQGLIIGIILGNGVFFYSFIAAYPDARLIWPALPYSVLFIGLGLSRKYYPI